MTPAATTAAPIMASYVIALPALMGLRNHQSYSFAMLGVAGQMSVGRFVVFVPEEQAARARDVLGEPLRVEPDDNPILRLIVVVAIITGLLLATPFVAQACYAPR